MTEPLHAEYVAANARQDDRRSGHPAFVVLLASQPDRPGESDEPATAPIGAHLGNRLELPNRPHARTHLLADALARHFGWTVEP